VTPRRILFVDDEPHVLEGLRDSLRKQRHEWDMVFVTSGEAALEALARAPFDVIVSDMRMPAMDGKALLTKVKQEYPGIVRLVLSGHTEREALVETLPIANQFLSKPIDSALLRIQLYRACDLQGLLANEALRRVVGRVDHLASPPRTYWEIRNALNRSTAGLREVAAIIEKDLAMTAKVLRLVNSAYFGLQKPIVSLSQAVSYLGVETLQGLALTMHVFSGAANETFAAGLSLEELGEHSLRTGRLAHSFFSDAHTADVAFAAGLVHDIGKLVLAQGLADYKDVVVSVRDSARPFDAVEKEMLGVTHAQVGAYILGVWGLPFDIVEAVAYHHEPETVCGSVLDVPAAVHIADALVGRPAPPAAGPDPVDELATQLGVEAKLPQWRAKARELIEVGT